MRTQREECRRSPDGGEDGSGIFMGEVRCADLYYQALAIADLSQIRHLS